MNFVKFSMQFLEELRKDSKETLNNLREKMHRNAGEILEIYGALLKFYSGGGASRLYSALELKLILVRKKKLWIWVKFLRNDR